MVRFLKNASVTNEKDFSKGTELQSTCTSTMSGGKTRIMKFPSINASDIQGNLFPGFGCKFQVFIFTRIVHKNSFRGFLRSIVNDVTSCESLLRLKNELRGIEGPDQEARLPLLNIAFSYSGMCKIGLEERLQDDPAFAQGLFRRRKLLGYADATWCFGDFVNPVDFLIHLGSQRESDLQYLVNSLGSSKLTGLEIAYVQSAKRLPNPFDDYEHFGFRDRIANPIVRATFVSATGERLSSVSQEAPESQSQSNIGEFIFGYPDEFSKFAAYNEDRIRNGAMLAVLRLRQDVPGFHRYLIDVTNKLRMNDCRLDNLTPSVFGAAIVGRWPNGQLFESRFSESSSHVHVAKSTTQKRSGARLALLRRGIPFGDLFGSQLDKGLIFVSYQKSIGDQFEAMAQRLTADALIGQHRRKLTFKTLNREGYLISVSVEIDPIWVRLTGGEYFFCPSVAFLKSV